MKIYSYIYLYLYCTCKYAAFVINHLFQFQVFISQIHLDLFENTHVDTSIMDLPT